MKRLFTLIVLLAFTVGMIGCAPKSETPAPEAATNAPAAAPEAPPATNQ